jgi:hypothetical protein
VDGIGLVFGSFEALLVTFLGFLAFLRLPVFALAILYQMLFIQALLAGMLRFMFLMIMLLMSHDEPPYSIAWLVNLYRVLPLGGC